MDGYSNLASSSPPAAANGQGARAGRPSMELTNTKETKAWEGLAIGAVTLARTFSTGSHRFLTLARTFSTGSHRFRRSGSERRSRSRSGLPGALRRAFSVRRYHPAGPGCGAGDGYWRIHDMDGGMSDSGDDTVVEEHGEDEAARDEEAESKKQAEQRDEDAAAAAAAAAADTSAGKEDGDADDDDEEEAGRHLEGVQEALPVVNSVPTAKQ